MNLPLGTTIDPQNYITTSLTLMHEFLSEFFTVANNFDAQIETVEQELTNPLPKPVIHFAINGGDTQKMGGVDLNAGTDVRGDFKDLIWSIRIVTDDNSGGALALSKYGGFLDHVLRVNDHYLASKGLRKNVLSPPIDNSIDAFYQKFFTLNNRLLLTWNVS